LEGAQARRFALVAVIRGWRGAAGRWWIVRRTLGLLTIHHLAGLRRLGEFRRLASVRRPRRTPAAPSRAGTSAPLAHQAGPARTTGRTLADTPGGHARLAASGDGN